MTKREFKENLKRGLGSAIVELKSCSTPEKYKEIILWCCLHNTCYDMQCEGGRGIYLYNAICIFEDHTYFEDEIILHFKNNNLASWLYDQYCELLYLFAKDGSKNARNVLYEKYDSLFALLSKKRRVGKTWPDRDHFEWLCVWLTSLDGIRQFKKIVKQVGEVYLLTKESNRLQLDWFYSNSKHKFGEKRVDEFFRIDEVKSDAVSAFLKDVNDLDTYKPKKLEPPTMEELIQACYEPYAYSSIGVALRFARSASLEELSELAKIALDEKDPEVKRKLLMPFRKRPFPLDSSYIFELAESNLEKIREIAFDIMELLPPEQIRNFVLNLINEENETVNSFNLLCHCYHPEDEHLLTTGVKGLKVSYDDGNWHGVFMDVEKLLSNRAYKFNPDLFLYIYHQTLCSSCRFHLVQSMYKRMILPLEILEQCRYDSNKDIRKFAERKLKKHRDTTNY